jgi:hypothetical protein
MIFRLLLAFAILLLPVTSRAMDCVKGESGYDGLGRLGTSLSIVKDACGSLKIVDRHRDNPEKKVEISAAYATFDPPATTAERAYNSWVEAYVAQMNWTGPVDTTMGGVSDMMSAFVYRSPRLLSASMGGWICCGAHGESWSRSLNIDAGSGKAIRLRDLVDAKRVTDHCWQVFAGLTGPIPDEGQEFVKEYPREKFGATDSVVWSVSDAGLSIEYGYLLAYVGAPFGCGIANDELGPFLKSGMSLPL